MSHAPLANYYGTFPQLALNEKANFQADHTYRLSFLKTSETDYYIDIQVYTWYHTLAVKIQEIVSKIMDEKHSLGVTNYFTFYLTVTCIGKTIMYTSDAVSKATFFLSYKYPTFEVSSLAYRMTISPFLMETTV
jgi:hypothetical protein